MFKMMRLLGVSIGILLILYALAPALSSPAFPHSYAFAEQAESRTPPLVDIHRELSSMGEGLMGDGIYAPPLSSENSGGPLFNSNIRISRHLEEQFPHEIGAAVEFLAAEMNYRMGLFSKAEDKYNQATREYRDTPYEDDAAFARIAALEAAGCDHQASQNWKKWYREYNSSSLVPDARLAEVWNAIRRGKGPEAGILLDKLVSDFPWMGDDSRVSLASSVIFYIGGQFTSALTVLDGGKGPIGNSLLTGPLDGMNTALTGPLGGMNTAAYVPYMRALCLLELGDEFAAVSQLSVLLSNFPDSPLSGYAWYIKGGIFGSEKDYSRAAQCFGRLAGETSREDIRNEAELMEAVSVLLSSREEESCELLENFVSKRPDKPLAAKAQFMLGEAMWRHSRYREAIVEFNRYLSEHFDHYLASAALYRVGRCFDALGQEKEALSTYRTIVSGYPLSSTAPAAAYLAGVNMIRMKHFMKAAACFQVVLDDYSDHMGNGRFVFDTGEMKELIDASLCLMAYCYYQEGDVGQLTGTIHNMIGRMRPSDSIWRAYAMLIDSHALAARGHYQKCRLSLERIASDFPDHPVGIAANRLNAWVYSEQGDVGKAIEIERNVMSRYMAMGDREGLGSSLLSLARLHFNIREYEQAVDKFQNFLKQYPEHENNLEARYETGICYLRMGRAGDAVDMWNSVVDTSPGSNVAERAWIRAGDIYFQARRFDQAKRCYRGLLENFPESDAEAMGMLRIAQCDYNEGNSHQALEGFRRVARDFTGSDAYGQAVRGIERSLYFIGVEQDSVRMLTELVEKYPRSSLAPDAQFKVGMKLYQREEYAAAAEAFKKVLDDFPEYSEAGRVFLHMADSYLHAGDREKARCAYRDVTDYFPESECASEAQLNLATMLYEDGKYSTAIAGFDRVLAGEPADDIYMAALYNLAMCHKIIGEPDRARTLLETYRENQGEGDARSAMVAYRLGNIYRQQGEIARAAREFERALSEGPPGELRLEILYRFGMCMEKLGDPEEAIAAYRKSFQSDEKKNYFRLSAVARFASLFESKGDYRSAIRAYRDIIKHAQNKEVVLAARQEVSRLETVLK
jgi:TolA-binding protein